MIGNTDKVRSQRGFSIVTVLVAVGIMGILMSGMASMFSQMFQSKSVLDKKVDMQNTNTLLRIGVLNAAACAKTLNLAKNPIRIEKSCLPLTKDGACTIPISKMVVAGSEFVAGGKDGNIGIDSMSFEIRSEPVQKYSYIGKLNVVVNAKAGNFPISSILGGPVMLKFEDDPLDIKKVLLKECMGTSAFDPKEVCESMSGDWLEATTDARYMPIPRCNIGTDILLGINEAPDGIPVDGTYGTIGTLSEGKRVTECLYQSNSNQKTNVWKCPAPSANLAGYRCAFDMMNKVWQVRYFSATNTPGKVWNTCNKGVTVATLDDSFDLLSYKQRIPLDGDDAAVEQSSGEFPITSVHDFVQQVVKIGSIKRCRQDAMTDVWIDCNKADGVAVEAKAGSCIFVHNMKMTSQSSSYKRIVTCNKNIGKHPIAECPEGTDFSYTGWMYAASARTDKPIAIPLVKTYLRTDIVEASGYPCFLTEYDRSIANQSPAFNILKNQVKPTTAASPHYCIVSSNNGGITTRFNAHLCDTTNRIATLINAKGIVTGITLKKGGCFYVNPSSNSFLPIKFSGFNQSKGTWIYLKADVANIQNLDLTLDALKTITEVKPSTKMNLANAIECTGGAVELLGEDISDGESESGEDTPTGFKYNDVFPLTANATSESPDLTDPALKNFIAQLSFSSTLKSCQTDYLNSAGQLGCVNDDVSMMNQKVGTCVFVSKVNASSSLVSLAAAHSKCYPAGECPRSSVPYSGWLRVTVARPAPTQTAAGVTTIGNTNGLMCYNLNNEYNEEMSETGMLKYISSAPTGPMLPKYCILQDNANKERFAALPCVANDVILDRAAVGQQELPINTCWRASSGVKINNTANSGSWVLMTGQADLKTANIVAPPMNTDTEVQDLNLSQSDPAKASNISAKRCIGVVY